MTLPWPATMLDAALDPMVASDPASGGGRVTILSDLSANLFAALLLILILMLQARVMGVSHDGRPSPPKTVEAASDLAAIPHRPLPAGSVVDLLRQRGPGFPGFVLDLTEAGLVIAGPSGHEERAVAGPEVAGVLGATLASMPADRPVRLYVFANRWYAPVVAQLQGGGLPWIELSVPAALRSDAGDDPWSAGFRTLIATPGSPAAFRAGLAHLLAATRKPLTTAGHAAALQTGGRASPVPQGSGAPVFDMAGLLHSIATLLGIAALAGGILFVAVVETVVLDPALRYPAGRSS